MKRRTSSAGLTIGQVLTLTLGFLVASLLIFVFGIWVGKDLVERRLAQEERIVRKPAEQLAAESRTLEAEVAAEQPKPAAAPTVEMTPRVTVRVAAAPTATPAKPPTPPRVAVWPTSTPHQTRREPPPAAAEAKPARPSGEEWADAGWTVQVYATTDPNQATALARRLVAKGYDAYTLQAPMRGQTWYRVRVGRFTSREHAKEMEQRLKTTEGMEAAYVTAQ